MVEQKYNSGMPVVPDLRDFDMASGGLFERMIFNNCGFRSTVTGRFG